jgi:hypothetical protein
MAQQLIDADLLGTTVHPELAPTCDGSHCLDSGQVERLAAGLRHEPSISVVALNVDDKRAKYFAKVSKAIRSTVMQMRPESCQCMPYVELRGVQLVLHCLQEILGVQALPNFVLFPQGSR